MIQLNGSHENGFHHSTLLEPTLSSYSLYWSVQKEVHFRPAHVVGLDSTERRQLLLSSLQNAG